MEEKKLSEIKPSFWPLFNIRRFNKSFLGEYNISSGFKYFRPLNHKSFRGFTLIELLVVIAMVAIMISFLLLFLNPFKQIQKARDAQRQSDLTQIRQGLDTYYNDKNCFPVSLSFGSSWQVGQTVYMKKIPNDPDSTSTYTYLFDNSQACPQWNVLFAKAANKPSSSTTCSLEQLPSCTPHNYIVGGYYCILSGKVDCSVISTKTLP